MVGRLILLTGSCLCACSGSDNVRATLERDRAGVAVVDNRAPFPESTVAADPIVRMGAAGGTPAHEFHDVRFAARLKDGRIVVVDGGSAQIRWFDASGRHRASVGGRGQGPGEFLDVRSGVLTVDDSLVVHDVRNQRIVVISPREAIVREERLAIGGRNARLLNVRPDGRVVISESRPVTAFGPAEFSHTRDSLAIFVGPPAALDTVVVRPGSEAVTWVRYSEGRPTGALQMELPFAYAVLPGATRQHIVLAAGERRQLEILDESGRLLRIARRSDVDPVPVSAADRTRYIDYITERARSLGAPDLALVIRGARDRVALLPEGREVPPFDRVIVDTDDRILVRDFLPAWAADRTQTWTVYSADGAVLARIRTPGGIVIMHVGGGHATGVHRDELGVEYVTIHRIDGS